MIALFLFVGIVLGISFSMLVWPKRFVLLDKLRRLFGKDSLYRRYEVRVGDVVRLKTSDVKKAKRVGKMITKVEGKKAELFDNGKWKGPFKE